MSTLYREMNALLENEAATTKDKKCPHTILTFDEKRCVDCGALMEAKQ